MMEEREETRKIQFTGKSSYIVSLPKQWVMDLGLKQGDQIRMRRKDSSTLEIYPPKFETRSQNKEDATIEIDNEETSSIVRKLISLYFLGYKTINIKPKTGRLSPSQRNTVKEAVKRMLMGSEIISDSSGGITVQVLVNLLELSVDGAFKRMIHLAKSMSNDAILAMRENNLELAQEVINTDDEVDRFGFYIIRQLKIAIQNEHMLKEMGFRNARDCLGYRLVVKNTEKTIEKTKEIIKYEKRVRDASKSLKDDEEIYRIRRMTENIRRISEYSSDIAEIVLNMNIEKSLKKTE